MIVFCMKRLALAIRAGYEYQIGIWRYNSGVGRHCAKIGFSFTL